MLLTPVDIFEKCLFPVKKKTNESSSIEQNDLGKLKEEIEFKNVLETNLEEIENTENDVLSKTEDLEEEKDLAKITELTDMDFCEIDLEIPENNEEDTLKLKNRNAVYFEMYREAKRKAKLARDFALSAYLEAKRIKNTYLMDEAFVSDDENDLEEKSLENVF